MNINFKEYQEMENKEKAISWLLHAIKILFGDESIRRYIILHYNKSLKNNKTSDVRTFDAFVKKGATRDEKANEIIHFCDKKIKKRGTVVFTASNIQRDKYDNETHFQTYIIDNSTKKIFIIDPAYDPKKENNAGIYMAEVTNEVIVPFFQSKKYETSFVKLSSPAQINEGDVFCQSWSLYILLEKLKNKEYACDLSFAVPRQQLDKYDMLLRFYKQVFTDMPELCENLKVEYEAEILECRGPGRPTKAEKQEFLSYNPTELLMEMTKYEMK